MESKLEGNSVRVQDEMPSPDRHNDSGELSLAEQIKVSQADVALLREQVKNFCRGS
jgi:hypothetical protein